MNILNYLIVSIFFVILLCSGVNSYGEGDADGHPTYSERSSLVTINIARNNPYAFSHSFMPLFTINNKVPQIYLYNSTAAPKKPVYYHSGLNALSNKLIDDIVFTANCNYTGLQFCNGTKFSQYFPVWFGENFPNLDSIGLLDSFKNTERGYGALMNLICEGESPNCNYDTGRENQPRLMLNRYHNNFGSASRVVNGITYFLCFSAESRYSLENPIPSASHFWLNGELHFYLTYRQPPVIPSSVLVLFKGKKREMEQYITPSSSPVYKNQPYSTFKYVIDSNFSDDECLTYTFLVNAFNISNGVRYDYTYKYPDTGYLTVSNDNSSCGAWTLTENDPFESSSSTEISSSSTEISSSSILSSLSVLLLLFISIVVSIIFN
ncbi:hypothetical protein DICPUDRAFT_81748 [Dictyostelium purpureum]|uniref:Uncharacterized protein n=1 Tax=Dictyostelium purpureum TaxID=5786 RepID=F0ZUG4_DICPU|nr:uncharacterized protein DICPUDRAFT_81748 [Dictyostelium purpureum]EGC32409.1 hypothetical protein DICPUDRAFT_81748 [Dictyostelium purpureum]|eukprot:XP_003291056.1 hypothetical protein DICPUDRAFT_81748 [Dictyostelium purpureum]